MIGLLLHCSIIPPDTQVLGDDEPPQPGFLGIAREFSLEDGNLAFYLPETKKKLDEPYDPIADREGNHVPELGIVNGKTTQTVFALHGFTEVDSLTHGHRSSPCWVGEWMREGDYSDLKANIEKIYEDIITAIAPKAKPFPSLKPEETYDPTSKAPYPVCILTLWSAVSSHDRESGFDELEGFAYKGLGKLTER